MPTLQAASEPVLTPKPVSASPPRLRILAGAVGLILLTAAGLKLNGLNVSPIPAVGTLSSPRLGIAVAAWEILLGLWLNFRYDAFAWLAALGTFTAFALVSGYFGIIGVASCGCFGSVKASPWTAFAVDLAAITLLLLARPRQLPSLLTATSRRGVLQGAGVASILAVVLATVAMIGYGSIGAAVATLRGEKIGLSTSYLQFEDGHVGDSLTAEINITNYSSQSLRIVGGTSDCSCTTTRDLPITIPPGESKPVTIVLKVPQTKSGQLTRKAILWTDNPEQRELQFRVGCRVD